MALLHRINAKGVCGQVQNFKRKITYFYEHHNGTVGSTAGFMKLEIRGDKVKIIINIQEPMGIPYDRASLCLYHEAGDHLSAIKVDRIESVDGVLTYQNRTDWQNIFRTERDLYTFDGVAVVYNDTHYYIGDFTDKDRSQYTLTVKEKKPIIVTMKPDVEEELQEVAGVASLASRVEMASLSDVSVDEKDVKAMCEECPYQKKQLEQGNEFEQMIATYPKLPMYGVTELFDCVRIHPRDIGKLDMRNWKLGVNSFLTHNFYTYQYLLLGKMRFDDGSSRCILGVPGVYSNRERYLANMFGFDQFVPVKQTGIKTGEFGYWIVEIVPSL